MSPLTLRPATGIRALALGAVLAGSCSERTQEATSRRGAPERAASPIEAPWLRDVTAEVGLDFTYDNGGTPTLLLPEVMGAGAALQDLDGDGLLDVYLTNGNRSLPEGRIDAEPTNRFFRQRPGGTFVDATAESGLGDGGYGLGVAAGDLDNDGDLDLVVANFGPDRLYENLGGGRFVDRTADSGLREDAFSSSVGLLDYDRDGLLDVYVCHYVVLDPGKTCFGTGGAPDYCSPKVFPPMPDLLLHNEGGLRFRDVSAQAGIAAAAAAGLGVVIADFDEDGWTDVHVANDGYANHLWLNRGDGTFREAAVEMGLAFDEGGMAEAGMGILTADVDLDLDLDVFVTNLRAETNTFYRNLGRGRGFADQSGPIGLGPPSSPFTAFGVAALDVELDGDLDVLVANGRVQRGDVLPGAGPPPPLDSLAEPNHLLLMEEGRYRLALEEGRQYTGPVEVSRALAVADVDRDGDLDVLVANIGSPARLYRNEAPRRGHWLAVRVVEPRWKRDALGALVTVKAGRLTRIQPITSATSYLTSVEPVAHFGLGGEDEVDWIEVRWPDGARERFAGGAADRRVELLRGSGTVAP